MICKENGEPYKDKNSLPFDTLRELTEKYCVPKLIDNIFSKKAETVMQALKYGSIKERFKPKKRNIKETFKL